MESFADKQALPQVLSDEAEQDGEIAI